MAICLYYRTSRDYRTDQTIYDKHSNLPLHPCRAQVCPAILSEPANNVEYSTAIPTLTHTGNAAFERNPRRPIAVVNAVIIIIIMDARSA